MLPTPYERFAAWAAILAGLTGFLYSVAFVVISRSSPELGGLLSALFLLVSGLLSSLALVGVYGRVRQAEPGFALWAVVLALAGALGAAIHGGYDLGNALNPPEANLASLANLPSQVDPRGLLTFGLAGLALLTFAWLMGQAGGFSRGLSRLGYLLGLLLVIIYLARLIVLQPTSPVLLIPALLAGFIVNPLWYVWLGLALRRGAPAPLTRSSPARA
jgi:hypothetical protein